jgi:uncharacterized paraquat-inducible protein A
LPRIVGICASRLLSAHRSPNDRGDFLYFPANLLPVLRVESTLSGTRQSTISAGMVRFWEEIPILKFIAIEMLCLGAQFGY